MTLINKGDIVYRRKSGYADFLQSLEYYDSAFQIAQSASDTFLLAQTFFAKGRAYDAINKDPQKTIDYYREAAALMSRIPGQYNTTLYLRHLVAHSYDKVQDSTDCIRVLEQLYQEIDPKPDSIKRQFRFTAEMALISTTVKNYSFAADILQHLTKREWIRNDSLEYDYLNHYYLTKARIDVFGKNEKYSSFLDSLETVFRNSRNFSDSAYIGSELLNLYRHSGDAVMANTFENINSFIAEELNNPNGIQKLQSRLSEMETAAIEIKREKAIAELKSRTVITWLLALILLAVAFLVFFLLRKNREILKSKKILGQVNNELSDKNVQNDLLNKEMHHRVKNNMQMILSLVYMQERSTESEEAKDNLRDIRLRIENVAALHSRLTDHAAEKTDLKPFVTGLVNAVAGLVDNNKHILTHLDIEPIVLPLKCSFPLGQLLNEWITNSVKHAISDTGYLVINISIKKEADIIRVVYHDSGRSKKDENMEPRLGMSIVDLLVTQLKGELVKRDGNTYFYDLIFTCE